MWERRAGGGDSQHRAGREGGEKTAQSVGAAVARLVAPRCTPWPDEAETEERQHLGAIRSTEAPGDAGAGKGDGGEPRPSRKCRSRFSLQPRSTRSARRPRPRSAREQQAEVRMCPPVGWAGADFGARGAWGARAGGRSLLFDPRPPSGSTFEEREAGSGLQWLTWLKSSCGTRADWARVCGGGGEVAGGET